MSQEDEYKRGLQEILDVTDDAEDMDRHELYMLALRVRSIAMGALADDYRR